MRVIHDVARTVGDSTVSQVVIYEFAQAQTDYWQHIHDAVIDYCTTPEGRQRVANGQMLTYGDFLDYVPDDFCQKHGFERTFAATEARHLDGQQTLIDRRDMTHWLHQHDREQERRTKLKKVLPRVTAEMNRARESIPKMSDWSFTRLATTAVRLAEDYVDNDLSGLRDFVEQRLEQLTTPKPAQKDEAQA